MPDSIPGRSSRARVLVTGATGYVGGRLVPLLLDAGHEVRVLARDPRRLQGRPWSSQVEIATGDVLRQETLPAAMAGVDAAYYLIHSMAGSGDFHHRDRDAAARLRRRGARRRRARRSSTWAGSAIRSTTSPSTCARARRPAPRSRAAGVPVTELRAAVIVGAGSLSFEMIRYLTERVPFMICPRWVYTRVQPIAVRDVLDYLVAALEAPAALGRVIEIGGADVLTYGEMMTGYARVRGLRRWLVPVPVLTPRLSSYWVHWVTPIPATIARPLIEGLRNEVVVRDDLARRLFPAIAPLGYDESVRLALARLEAGAIETSWSDALASSRGDQPPVTLTQQEGMIIERRERTVPASAAALFATFTGLGGRRGWLAWNWALARCAGRSTGCSAASGSGAAAATRTRCASAMRSTSGGSRRSNPTGCCDCARR